MSMSESLSPLSLLMQLNSATGDLLLLYCFLLFIIHSFIYSAIKYMLHIFNVLLLPRHSKK